MTDCFCPLPDGRQLCYRTSGNSSDEPLVLIAGLGLQLVDWPEDLVAALVRHGFYVVRFDNRDVGRSTRLTTPPPGRMRQLARRFPAEQYTLADMAADTVALLDHLGLDDVHLVGMSMGGMIAQTIAVSDPQRVRTLTSIFSTTGHRRAGKPALSTVRRLMQPAATTAAEAQDRKVAMTRHIGSVAFRSTEADVRAAALRAWERNDGALPNPGVARQIGAIYKSGDRTALLRAITAPTLVIHGDRDLMVHPSGGRATAAAIPGARLVTIDGMGHELARGVCPQLADLVAAHAGAPRRAVP